MASLFEELKRRKVFKVAAAYAVVAWVLIQVSGEVLPTFGAPQWVQQTITFLFFLGFPITMVMAWAYEVTPDGLRPDSGIAAQQVVANSTDRKLIYVILAMVSLLGGLQISDRMGSETQVGSLLGNSANSSNTSTVQISRRFLLDIGETNPIGGPGLKAELALSADGSRLAYLASTAEQQDSRLYIQELDQLQATRLTSTFAYQPTFSPDGEWIAYAVGENALAKISLRGGVAQVLADSIRGDGGLFWGPDDTLIYPTSANSGLELMRISAYGGEPVPIESADGRIRNRVWPWLLPNGDGLLLTAGDSDQVLDDATIELLVQSTGELTPLIRNGYNARYVPSGHIVFMRDSSLWAVPFDATASKITGPEVPVIQGVSTNTERGTSAYSFSSDGLLVYIPGYDVRGGDVRTMLWVDRDGNTENLPLVRDYRVPVISPDGETIAVVVEPRGENADIWTYDLQRNNLVRLTFSPGSDFYPLWSVDGSRIVFYSEEDGGGLWWQRADGSAPPELLLSGVREARPTGFTPDGEQLLYDVDGDVFLLSLGSEEPPRTLLQTPFTEGRAVISPNGRWIAYHSDESGRFEVYVRSFPDLSRARYQVSLSGGYWPKWNADGTELFYRTTGVEGVEGGIWSVKVTTETAFEFEMATLVASGPYRGVAREGAFDISADGSRFLMIYQPRFDEAERSAQLVVVENWFAELNRLAKPFPEQAN